MCIEQKKRSKLDSICILHKCISGLDYEARLSVLSQVKTTGAPHAAGFSVCDEEAGKWWRENCLILSEWFVRVVKKSPRNKDL